MNFRYIGAGLWFLAAAYAGSILHTVAGMPDVVGPVVGIASGALIIADPLRRLSDRNATAGSAAGFRSEPLSDLA